MKSSIRAALAVGALALASSQAYASSISVYEGMSPVMVSTTNQAAGLDPRDFGLTVTGASTTMLTRLLDTSPDGGTPPWTVTYELWTDADPTAGFTAGTIVQTGPSVMDMGYSLSNPSAWFTWNPLSAGQYVLRISTDGATGSDSHISAVPLPAAAWLFGSALLGLGAMRRKQKTSSEMALA